MDSSSKLYDCPFLQLSPHSFFGPLVLFPTTSCTLQTAVDSSTSGSMYPSSTFPPTVGGGPSTQVSGAILGAVVSAVVVLVVGSVVVAASLIAWKVRSTKASTGMHCTVVHIGLCGMPVQMCMYVNVCVCKCAMLHNLPFLL